MPANHWTLEGFFSIFVVKEFRTGCYCSDFRDHPDVSQSMELVDVSSDYRKGLEIGFRLAPEVNTPTLTYSLILFSLPNFCPTIYSDCTHLNLKMSQG